MSLLQNSNAIETGGYNIANSLRFQSASSQYLSRTYSTTRTSGQILTYSAWIKRGVLSSSAEYSLFGAYDGSPSSSRISFKNDSLSVVFGGSANNDIVTTAVYRDPSAWYHVVVAIDTTQATNTNRIKVYVNGTQVTSFGTTNYPAQNSNSQFLYTGANNRIGVYGDISGGYFDGYISELNIIDGQALTPSSFGETNTLTGQWVAKKYNGTYGTNGFYLPFSNGTSTTTLGADSSGNSNNWTLTNFTRSAGVNDCWMIDVPSGNGSAVGGTQPNSNYPVINLLKRYNANMAITNANLTASDGSTASTTAVATMSTGISGKYYFECTMTAVASSSVGSGSNFVGVTNEGNVNGNGVFLGTGAYRSGNPIYNLAGTAQTAGASYTTGDVIGVAVDVTAGTVQFYKNNVAQGATPSFTFTAGTELWAFVGTDNVAGTKTYNLNFGQRSFAYTPPSGFKALCTANLPASTIVKGNEYMDATLYTGNGATLSVTNAGGFSPDLVWYKRRDAAGNHNLYDVVRGVTNYLTSNGTGAEIAGVSGVTSFNSNGFTIGSHPDGNTSGGTFVAWQWDAGSSTVTNTNGSISSQVRANPTAGVSVVTWTGTSAVGTVGHGLGVAPKMIIAKSRSTANSWGVFHQSANSGAGQNGYLLLNSTAAYAGDINAWNNTAPTSSVFSVANGGFNVGTMVAYCFSEIAGFSKFGSYTGNGSADGVFNYLGFLPKFVMIKRTNSTGQWVMYDTSRNPYNVTDLFLNANQSAAEGSGITYPCAIDILSNGFKTRNYDATYGVNINASGGTYIYMAFASNPFSASNAR